MQVLRGTPVETKLIYAIVTASAAPASTTDEENFPECPGVDLIYLSVHDHTFILMEREGPYHLCSVATMFG